MLRWKRSQSHCSAALATLCLMTAGCGTSSNVNRLWGGEDHAGDSLLLESRMAYDRGDFTRAQDLALQLVQRDPNNEDAAVLLGFVNLSQGGIDPYILARELVAMSSTGSGTGTGTGTSTSGLMDLGFLGHGPRAKADAGDGEAGGYGLGTGTGTSTSSSAGSATDELRALGTLVQVSQNDIQNNLSAHKFGAADNSINKTPTTPTLFTVDPATGIDYSLEVPAQVTDQLRAAVATLNYMNQAITSICPFVDADVKIAEGAGRCPIPTVRRPPTSGMIRTRRTFCGLSPTSRKRSPIRRCSSTRLRATRCPASRRC